jgi:AcrR family transcriptional regulator
MDKTMSARESDAATPAEPSKRERILRAAEKLFAQHGYDGTSMRDIALEARVGLPLIVYHFETKELLYTAIFLSREYVNDERLGVLEAVGDLHSQDAVQRIVAAFVDPVLDLHEEPTDKSYARLVLREVSDPSSDSRPAIRDLFLPVAQHFVSALHQALPDKSHGFHEWAYLFTVGALTMSAYDDRVGSVAETTSPEQKRAFLKSYISAALTYG